MSNELNTIESYTSAKSLASLVQCWTEEANRQKADGFEDATPEGVGASMYSDDHKDLHGVRFVPSFDTIEELADSFARLRFHYEEEIRAEERAEKMLADAKEAAFRPSPAFTIGDAWEALA
jgi:hypothetical protein